MNLNYKFVIIIIYIATINIYCNSSYNFYTTSQNDDYSFSKDTLLFKLYLEELKPSIINDTLVEYNFGVYSIKITISSLDKFNIDSIKLKYSQNKLILKGLIFDNMDYTLRNDNEIYFISSLELYKNNKIIDSISNYIFFYPDLKYDIEINQFPFKCLNVLNYDSFIFEFQGSDGEGYYDVMSILGDLKNDIFFDNKILFYEQFENTYFLDYENLKNKGLVKYHSFIIENE